MNDRFLRLTPNFLLLWGLLWFLLVSKVLLLRGIDAANLTYLAVLGVVMIAASYLGAWGAWAVSGKKRRTADFAFLGILVAIFLVETIRLYREGFQTL